MKIIHKSSCVPNIMRKLLNLQNYKKAIGMEEAHKQGYQFLCDSVAKFFSLIYIYGWFYHENDCLASIDIEYKFLQGFKEETNIPHHGVLSLGENLGFRIQIFRQTESMNDPLYVIFTTKKGVIIRVSMDELCKARISRYPSIALSESFIKKVQLANDWKVLDIGGRARSKVDRSKYFPNCDYTVLDILPGDNVDIVGDAHKLSTYFARNYFDAIYSTSVFEHIALPWAVVIQMNKVLKCGGLAFISSHQTLGMHDAPWDFWRFSDSAWMALFNKTTGFEIIDTALDFEQYVVPFIWHPIKLHAEKSAGFEGSCVLVKKISETNLSWDVVPADFTSTVYPDVDDNTCLGPDVY